MEESDTKTYITKEDKNLVVESLTKHLKDVIDQIHKMENTPDLDELNIEAHKLLCAKRDSIKSNIVVFSALKKGLTIEIS